MSTLWGVLLEQCGATDMFTGGRLPCELIVFKYRGSISANMGSLLKPLKTSANELVSGNWSSTGIDSVCSILGETFGDLVGEPVGDLVGVIVSSLGCSGVEGSDLDGSEEDGSDDVGDLWTIGGVPSW